MGYEQTVDENIRLRGTVGKATGQGVTFQVRNGQQISYPYTVPTDPQTPAQLAQRQKLTVAMIAWQALTPKEQADWNRRAWRSGRTITGHNLFLSKHMKGEI